MIAAVTETLAELLAGGTSFIEPHQIDLERPRDRDREGTGIYLYCYDFRACHSDAAAGDGVRGGSTESDCSADEPAEGRSNLGNVLQWFHISFLICTWGFSALGQLRALSELIELLSQHSCLPEDALVASLRGRGRLPLQMATQVEPSALWHTLGLPMRPAIYVTVQIPVGGESVDLGSLEPDRLQSDLPPLAAFS